jgi:hypothetical protein
MQWHGLTIGAGASEKPAHAFRRLSRRQLAMGLAFVNRPEGKGYAQPSRP